MLLLSNVLQENIGYTPQQAWVQHGTLRDNVCFGRPFRENRYHKVIEACSLTTDLKILAAGDMTELGGKVKIMAGLFLSIILCMVLS